MKRLLLLFLLVPALSFGQKALTFQGVGHNIVTDGEFNTACGVNWGCGTGWTITGGVGIADVSSNGWYIQQAGLTTAGKIYKLTFTIVSRTNGGVKIRLGNTGDWGTTRSAVGTYTEILTSYHPAMQIASVAFQGSIDNVTVQEWTAAGRAITYQGSTSLMDAGKGKFADIGGADSTESWAALGTNTIANDAGALKITYGDNASGARVYLNQASDLNIDLTIGKTYKIVAKAKVNTGSVLMQHYNGSVYVSFGTVSSTSYVLFTGTFVAAHATACSFVMSGMSAGEIIWIDEWTIEEWFPDGRVMILN